MSATLSPSAVHRIICLVLDAPIVNQWYPPRVLMTCVNNVWTTIYKLYMRLNPPLPVDSLGSFELGLVLKGEVDEEDVGAIFAQDKPLEFWGCPRWIVTKIVEVCGTALCTGRASRGKSILGVRCAAEGTDVPRRDDHCASRLWCHEAIGGLARSLHNSCAMLCVLYG